MRIINTVFGDATGGRWRVVLDYARVLTDLGHEVLLVLNRRTASEVKDLPAGVSVAWIRNSGHYDLIAVWQARRLINKFSPDTIIAHCGRSVGVMKWAAHRKLPVIGVCHSNNVKRIVPADAYLNISTHIDRLIREFPNHSSLAYHLPNMIEVPDGTVFLPRELHQPPVIGAMGRFDRVKGFDVYLQALAKLKQRGVEFSALLGGGGEDEQALRRLAKEFEIDQRLAFIGWVSDPEAFFREIDIICIPSRSDAFGITPLEAAVAGVPQVLSDAEGHRDMFTSGEHALLILREQPEALADALQLMLEDYATAQLLARKAFDRVVTCYSENEFTRKLEMNLMAVVNHFSGGH